TPEHADNKNKFISAAGKQVLITKLDVSFQIEGTDAKEIAFETVLDKVRRLK
ncbi:12750_t:CDS:1, partial [Gigaspora margarita]